MIQDENFPYFIIAPHYAESSAGIQAMHRLCHLLNTSGQQAWMIDCDVNPAWNTPMMPSSIVSQYRANGGKFIAIYPEVVEGNPLHAPVVVRYMLNREGVMNGNPTRAHHDDIIFWYRPEFAEKAVAPDILNIECYDLELFRDEHLERESSLLYLNRVPVSAVDFSTLPADIEILSMANPLTLTQLAAKLKRTRVLYMYESSGTGLLAILCGCPIVARTAKGFEKYAMTQATAKETNADVICWDDRPETLAHAHENLWRMRDELLKRRQLTQKQLDKLIALSQQALLQQRAVKEQTQLENWLVNRSLQPALLTRLALESTPQLQVVIFDDADAPERLTLTLDTLGDAPVSVVVVSDRDAFGAYSFAQWLKPEAWPAHILAMAQQGRLDWLQCLPAGSLYTSACWSPLFCFLQQNADSAFIYADEMWLNPQGQPVPHLKAALDWDRFSASPAAFLKRGLFARKVLLELAETAFRAPAAFESDLFQQLYRCFGEAQIRHYADVLCILPQPEMREEEHLASAAVLENALQERGFPHAQIELHDGQPMRVLYGHDSLPKVSLVIVAGNSLALLERVVTGILQNNNWPSVELLVVNHLHDNAELNTWLSGLATIDPAMIRVIQTESPWQPVSLRNRAAEEASGEFLLLLDPAIMFVTDNWLSSLMNLALRPDVGCVGPKFIGLKQEMLSAGMIAGFAGLAEHAGKEKAWNTPDQAGYYQSDRQVRLLSGQCLLVRRTCWQTCGGMAEEFNDLTLAEIDFAMKLEQAGFRSIWSPHSVVALEGTTRGVNPHSVEADTLRLRWGLTLLRDPFYPQACSLSGSLFSIDETHFLHWQATRLAKVPRVLVVQGDENAPGAARLMGMLEVAEQQQKISTLRVTHLNARATILRWQPNHIVVAGCALREHQNDLAALAMACNATLSCLPEVTQEIASLVAQHKATAIHHWLVWSEEQRQALQQRKLPVRLLPALVTPGTHLPSGQTKLRALCDIRELGRADLRFFTQVVVDTAALIDWVLWGDAPAGWLDAIAETHRTCPGPIAGAALATLSLDIAVVFRLQNDENRGKDDYSLLNYQAAGLPVVCSDVPSLARRYSGLRVRNKEKNWITTLTQLQQTRDLPVVACVTDDHCLSDATVDAFLTASGLSLA